MAGTILDRYPDPEFVRDAFDHLGDYNTETFKLARADALNEDAVVYRNPRHAIFQDQLSNWIAGKKEERKRGTAKAEAIPTSPKSEGLYKPISDRYEIRVLQIHPASQHNDPLKASLVHCTVEFEYKPVLRVPNTTGPYFGLKTKHALSIDLEQPVFYTALSYTWGSGGFDAIIECDGRPLPITTSLETALRHFRRDDHAIVMWIDQICIDQDNAAEKAQQIPLMSKIYSRALNTAIWLGEGIKRVHAQEKPSDTSTARRTADDADGTAIAFDLLRQIRINLQFASDAVKAADLPRLGLPAADAEAWTLLRALFARPWFQRLWVIQEAILSDSPFLACGATAAAPTLATMPFEEFTNACSTLVLSGLHELLLLPTPPTPDDRSPSGCRMALDLSYQREQYLQLQGKLKLVETLVFTRYARCYFPHDKVYGLLGVCERPASVAVDYGRDAGELYREVAVGFLEDAIAELERVKAATHNQDMRVARFSVFDVLIAVDHEVEEVKGEKGTRMPSWVPDWRRERVTEALGHSTSTLAFYEAGGRMDPGLEVAAGGHELVVSGKIFDVVGEVTDAFAEPHLGLPVVEESGSSTLLVCLEMVRRCIASRGQCDTREPCGYAGGGKIFEAFWHTLVAGKDESGKQRCPPDWSLIFSLLLDATTGMKYALPDQEYDKRQELPDGHPGKITVASLGNWDAQGLQHSSITEGQGSVAQTAQEQQPPSQNQQKGKKKQKKGKKQGTEIGQRKLAKTFQDVQKAVRHAMRNRHFGTTEKKYFGLFPNHGKVGDLICVFAGSHVPFLIRKRSEVGMFQLVGECYIHGIMGGEVMDAKNIQLDRIRLT